MYLKKTNFFSRKDMAAYMEKGPNPRKNPAMRGNACTMIIVVQAPFA